MGDKKVKSLWPLISFFSLILLVFGVSASINYYITLVLGAIGGAISLATGFFQVEAAEFRKFWSESIEKEVHILLTLIAIFTGGIFLVIQYIYGWRLSITAYNIKQPKP